MTYPESALDIARSMVPRMEWTCPRSWSGPPDEYACAEPCPDVEIDLFVTCEGTWCASCYICDGTIFTHTNPDPRACLLATVDEVREWALDVFTVFTPDPPPDVVWHSNNPVGKETP